MFNINKKLYINGLMKYQSIRNYKSYKNNKITQKN